MELYGGVCNQEIQEESGPLVRLLGSGPILKNVVSGPLRSFVNMELERKYGQLHRMASCVAKGLKSSE